MSQKHRRPTLQDVADLVGVTKMTVSRYLKDASLVSAQAQEKIAAALDELGYIPNRAPDLLSNAKSKAIGVLVPSLTNQVFSEVIRGIEFITEQAGYQTMLAHYGYSSEVEQERIASLLSYHVDGLILSESYHTERTLRMIQTAGIPVVEIMDSRSPFIEQAVGFDNEAACYAMTNLMIQKGYRKIVYFGARMDVRTRLKMNGYTAAMNDAGLESFNLTTDAASSFSLGAELLNRARVKYPDMDGIVCTNDDLAIGAVFECQRLGIRVPEDIGISGFHGHDISLAMVPKLATVLTPREKIGEIAAQQLLKRIHSETADESVIDLGFTLSSGESI